MSGQVKRVARAPAGTSRAHHGRLERLLHHGDVGGGHCRRRRLEVVIEVEPLGKRVWRGGQADASIQSRGGAFARRPRPSFGLRYQSSQLRNDTLQRHGQRAGLRVVVLQQLIFELWRGRVDGRRSHRQRFEAGDVRQGHCEGWGGQGWARANSAFFQKTFRVCLDLMRVAWDDGSSIRLCLSCDG